MTNFVFIYLSPANLCHSTRSVHKSFYVSVCVLAGICDHVNLFHPLRPDFMSKLVHGLAFWTPKFYITPKYDKINHGVVNVRYNCNVKSGLSAKSQATEFMPAKLKKKKYFVQLYHIERSKTGGQIV